VAGAAARLQHTPLHATASEGPQPPGSAPPGGRPRPGRGAASDDRRPGPWGAPKPAEAQARRAPRPEARRAAAATGAGAPGAGPSRAGPQGRAPQKRGPRAPQGRGPKAGASEEGLVLVARVQLPVQRRRRAAGRVVALLLGEAEERGELGALGGVLDLRGRG
jgi:hypothetical protein